MDAVGLVERRLPGHLVEQERNQQHMLLACDVGKRAAIRLHVLGTVVGRRLHAGEDDDDVPFLGALDDRREVLLHLVDRETAQAVVGAERHDEDANVALERPVETAQAASRRLTRHSGIHDFERIAVLVQFLL